MRHGRSILIFVGLFLSLAIEIAIGAGGGRPAGKPPIIEPGKIEVPIERPEIGNKGSKKAEAKDIKSALDELRTDKTPADFSMKSDGNETWYRATRLPKLKFKKEALFGGDSWLTSALSAAPIIVSLVEHGQPLAANLRDLSNTDAIPKVIEAEPNAASIENALSQAQQGQPIIFLFHNVRKDSGEYFVSNLGETKQVAWEEIRPLINRRDRVAFPYSCSSSCLTGVKAGLNEEFFAQDALASFRELRKSNTMADVLTSLAISARSELSVFSPLLDVIEVQGETKSGGSITGQVPIGAPSQGPGGPQADSTQASQVAFALASLATAQNYCEHDMTAIDQDPKCLGQTCLMIDRAITRVGRVGTFRRVPVGVLLSASNCHSRISQAVTIVRYCLLGFDNRLTSGWAENLETMHQNLMRDFRKLGSTCVEISAALKALKKNGTDDAGVVSLIGDYLSKYIVWMEGFVGIVPFLLTFFGITLAGIGFVSGLSDGTAIESIGTGVFAAVAGTFILGAGAAVLGLIPLAIYLAFYLLFTPIWGWPILAAMVAATFGFRKLREAS